MPKTVSFSLYVNIHGEVEVDDYKGDPNELLGAIFPDGWKGEVFDVFTDPSFMPKGYIDILEIKERR